MSKHVHYRHPDLPDKMLRKKYRRIMFHFSGYNPRTKKYSTCIVRSAFDCRLFIAIEVMQAIARANDWCYHGYFELIDY